MSRRPSGSRRSLAALACAARALGASARRRGHLQRAQPGAARSGNRRNDAERRRGRRLQPRRPDGRRGRQRRQQRHQHPARRRCWAASRTDAGSPIALGAASPVDIAAGDLDRDGFLDLVVAFGTQVQVMRGLARSGFDNTCLPFAVGPTATPDLPRGLDARRRSSTWSCADDTGQRYSCSSRNRLQLRVVLATDRTSSPGRRDAYGGCDRRLQPRRQARPRGGHSSVEPGERSISGTDCRGPSSGRWSDAVGHVAVTGRATSPPATSTATAGRTS